MGIRSFFRFPFGDQGNFGAKGGTKDHKAEITAFLLSEGFKDYLWDVDSGDWRHYAQGKSIDSVLSEIGKAKEGAVVLTHDLPINPKYILPFVVRYYHSIALGQ